MGKKTETKQKKQEAFRRVLHDLQELNRVVELIMNDLSLSPERFSKIRATEVLKGYLRNALVSTGNYNEHQLEDLADFDYLLYEYENFTGDELIDSGRWEGIFIRSLHTLIRFFSEPVGSEDQSYLAVREEQLRECLPAVLYADRARIGLNLADTLKNAAPIIERGNKFIQARKDARDSLENTNKERWLEWDNKIRSIIKKGKLTDSGIARLLINDGCQFKDRTIRRRIAKQREILGI